MSINVVNANFPTAIQIAHRRAHPNRATDRPTHPVKCNVEEVSEQMVTSVVIGVQQDWGSVPFE